MTAVVFLGPSLPIDEARKVFPDGVYLPPARQGDVLSVLADRPLAIALVDGEFRQARSVWHKEILVAIESGVRVFGASSMGALRAAELEPFGMAGVGRVFAAYASGELIDDDEVALLYHDEDGVYTHLSEPMVNIRATLEAAGAAGVPAAICDQALAEAKAMYYPERSRAAVVHRLRALGADRASVEQLDRFWRERPVDAKADDARLLLSLMRGFVADPPPPGGVGLAVARTASLDTLATRERWVRADQRRVVLDDIAQFVQLHHPGAAELNAAALNRALALTLSDLIGMEIGEAEVDEEIRRWRIRHDCRDDDEFAAWLQRNHLSDKEFRLLAADGARCRQLWRWLLYARQTARTTGLVLDQLRWTGEYEQWAQRAAACEGAAEYADGQVFDEITGPQVLELVGEHARRVGRPLDSDVAVWAEEAGFDSPEHLLVAIARTVSTASTQSR